MESWYEKNVDVLLREERLLELAKFNVYWIMVNGIRYHHDGAGRFVSEDFDELDYFREFDGESWDYWLKDEVTPDDVTYLQHSSYRHDLEAVFNGGLHAEDYRAVESLDILYDGEV